MSTRLIYVDDTSPLISYQGSWDNGDRYSRVTGNTQWGGPFDNTLHALSGSGGFSFNFTGRSVSVIGSFQSSTKPSWTCYLDGYKLISYNITLNLNNVEICSLQNIESKTTPSNLTVEAVGTKDSPFLFDRIQYIPNAGVVPDSPATVVDAFDDKINYSSGWNDFDGFGMETSVPGSSLAFDFVGIQITWMTTLSYLKPIMNSSAQYSIDNGTLFPFQVAGQNSTAQLYNLASFQTPVLPPGSHHLFVQYGVNNPNGSAPLRLDYLVIHNHTILPFTSTHTKHISTGELSGIVIGSLVGAALIIFGILWVIRFFKRKWAADGQPALYQGVNDDGRDE